MRLPAPLKAAYEVGDRLGQGSFSSVLRATERATGDARAIKAIDKARLVTAEERAMPRREIEALQRLGAHAHAVRLFASFEDDDHVFLVLELAEKGSLRDVICAHPFGLPDAEAKRIMRQLLRVVAHLHSLGHVHLDVAPSNVLLDGSGSVKLADFGLSRRLSDADATVADSTESGDALALDSVDSAGSDEESVVLGAAPAPAAAAAATSSTTTTTSSSSATSPTRGAAPVKKISSSSMDGVPGELGTMGYVAPEVLAGKVISELADAWSCGAILHEVATGTTPVYEEAESDPASSSRVRGAGVVTFPDSLWGADKPASCVDVCRGLLTHDYLQRTTAAEALAMPWLALP